jgi:hypothetical protein
MKSLHFSCPLDTYQKWDCGINGGSVLSILKKLYPVPHSGCNYSPLQQCLWLHCIWSTYSPTLSSFCFSQYHPKRCEVIGHWNFSFLFLCCLVAFNSSPYIWWQVLCFFRKTIYWDPLPFLNQAINSLILSCKSSLYMFVFTVLGHKYLQLFYPILLVAISICAFFALQKHCSLM